MSKELDLKIAAITAWIDHHTKGMEGEAVNEFVDMCIDKMITHEEYELIDYLKTLKK